MSLEKKLNERLLDINKSAGAAWENENLEDAISLKTKEIYFRKVLANIIAQEDKYHKNANISNLSKVSSDPVYQNSNNTIKQKIIDRALTRKEYNLNLPEWYMEEGWYYDDHVLDDKHEKVNVSEEIIKEEDKNEIIKSSVKELVGIEDDISEEDYQEWVEQGKLIGKIKKYFENSLLWPESMSSVLKKNYHWKTKNEYIEKLYKLSFKQVKNISEKIEKLEGSLDQIYEIIELWIKVGWEGAIEEKLKKTFLTIHNQNTNIREVMILLGIEVIKSMYIDDLISYKKSVKDSEGMKINSRSNLPGYTDKWRQKSKLWLDHYDFLRDKHGNRWGRGDYYKILNNSFN